MFPPRVAANPVADLSVSIDQKTGRQRFNAPVLKSIVVRIQQYRQFKVDQLGKFPHLVFFLANINREYIERLVRQLLFSRVSSGIS